MCRLVDTLQTIYILECRVTEPTWPISYVREAMLIPENILMGDIIMSLYCPKFKPIIIEAIYY